MPSAPALPSPTPRRVFQVAALLAGAWLLTACAPWRLWATAQLTRDAQPFTAQPAQPLRRVLVVGDSTAVGTGANAPADSLAGLISQDHPRWHIDNLASNGARFADVVQQLEGAPGGYDLVLVLAGANDVIRMTGRDSLQGGMHQALQLARNKGTHVVLMPCGDAGNAPFFAPPLSWLMSRRSHTLHAIAQDAAQVHGARYVRLLRPRAQDPFVIHKDELNARDGLHPSSAGYREWYAELVRQGGLAGMGE